jgi:hypothetical protein
MHDASRFPLVRLRRRAVKPGYAFAWRVEMQRLLALKTPFVIVSEHGAVETIDDTRLRTAWLRSQSATLSAYCRGFIVTQDSGVRTVVVSSMRVAVDLAPVLLKHSAAEQREAAGPAGRRAHRAAPL